MPADVVVKKSKIEGKGVFAARDFKKGDIVVRWDASKELSKEEAENWPENEKKFIAFFGGKYFLQQPPARFVNHSCEPNTFARGFCDVAARDIRKGEEITADYAKCPAPGMDMRCSCGSKKCRGTIK